MGSRVELFEAIRRDALREAGFISATVTGRTGDGGIDGLGSTACRWCHSLSSSNARGTEEESGQVPYAFEERWPVDGTKVCSSQRAPSPATRKPRLPEMEHRQWI
jgi:hypothetical protein